MASHFSDHICVKFDLLHLKHEELKKVLENVQNEKVCVVSVIGKTSLNSPNFKEHVIAEALSKHIFQNEDEEKENDPKCDVKGYYDASCHTVFLQMQGISDTFSLTRMCKKMEEDLKIMSFLEVWSDLHFDFLKILLVLFCISHIIIVVHPVSTFDLSYVYLFRALDTLRIKALPWFRELLSGVDVSPEWIQNARPCSPRVLFVFESCHLLCHNETASSDSYNWQRHKKQSPLKKLEHSLEDQIYRILRKSRVITNVSGNSLFAVPANQEFVYIFSSKPFITDFIGFVLTQIRAHCQTAKELDVAPPLLSSKPRSSFGNVFENGSNTDHPSSLGVEGTDHNFSKFLFDHINLALTKGFDDNVGRFPVPAYFELAKAHTWFEIACCLLTNISDPKDAKGKSIIQLIKTSSDTDVKFSEGRCAKVLPLASAAYQENLPTHYTEDFHQTRLEQALHVFSMHARGPAVQRFAKQLKEDCERLWKSGHQMCEMLSLTGNHCINPLHVTDEKEQEEKILSVMQHCSQLKIVSTCNCGRKQSTREDPFDLKAANYDFYASERHQCCRDLEKMDFPVFQACSSSVEESFSSTTESTSPLDPSTLPLSGGDQSDEKSKEGPHLTSGSGHGQTLSKPELSEENCEETFLSHELDEEQLSRESQQSQVEEERDEIVIQVHPEGSSSSEKKGALIRQPSTTEYLSSMLHSESRPGLLPTFSSWSLVCLGPSSLYSHNIGLQDQPGFIPGTAYLLPWDVTVRLEQREHWPALWEGKRPLSLKAKKAIRDGPQFNVKIFIGVEYECYRGHRFMCSAPDRVLRVTNSGHVKDNASKVTGSNMPLYFPCPCRSSKPQLAQLMRIHVVTPKAPVHVTLRPKVQPAPDPCPLFYPTLNEPLKLSQSAYWILRLPFVYEGEYGAYFPPRENVSIASGKLLKGTYNIAEQQSSRDTQAKEA